MDIAVQVHPSLASGSEAGVCIYAKRRDDHVWRLRVRTVSLYPLLVLSYIIVLRTKQKSEPHTFQFHGISLQSPAVA